MGKNKKKRSRNAGNKNAENKNAGNKNDNTNETVSSNADSELTSVSHNTSSFGASEYVSEHTNISAGESTPVSTTGKLSSNIEVFEAECCSYSVDNDKNQDAVIEEEEDASWNGKPVRKSNYDNSGTHKPQIDGNSFDEKCFIPLASQVNSDALWNHPSHSRKGQCHYSKRNQGNDPERGQYLDREGLQRGRNERQNQMSNVTHERQGGNRTYSGKQKKTDFKSGRDNSYEQQEGNRPEKWNTQRGEYDFPKNSLLKFKEVDGDLFLAPKEVSLAHCVAEDMKMGSGIAVTFRQNFKRLAELYGQRKRVGDVAILEDEGRYIYYLITKKVSNGKPTLDDLCRSLEAMRQHCESKGVKSLAMPRIGCGLDRLEWKEVSFKLKCIFSSLPMEITVYNFNQMPDNASKPHTTKKLRIEHRVMNLVSIARETLLVFFGCVSDETNHTICTLNSKFNFLAEYKQSKRQLGSVVDIWKKNELICGLIVKNKASDLLSYEYLNESLLALRKLFRDNNYYYVGIEAFQDGDDDLTMEKIISLLRMLYCYDTMEVWVCWPEALASISPAAPRYVSH